MIIIEKNIPIAEINKLAKEGFGNLVKAVVDIEKQIIAAGAELHSDEEAVLLESGSKQSTLWGINIYPEKTGDDWIEFDSMINLRPSQNNHSRGVDDSRIRVQIVSLVNKLVQR